MYKQLLEVSIQSDTSDIGSSFVEVKQYPDNHVEVTISSTLPCGYLGHVEQTRKYVSNVLFYSSMYATEKIASAVGKKYALLQLELLRKELELLEEFCRNSD